MKSSSTAGRSKIAITNEEEVQQPRRSKSSAASFLPRKYSALSRSSQFLPVVIERTQISFRKLSIPQRNKSVSQPLAVSRGSGKEQEKASLPHGGHRRAQGNSSQESQQGYSKWETLGLNYSM